MAEQPPLLDSTGRDPLVFYLFDVDGTLTEVRKVSTNLLILLCTTSHVCVLATSLVSNALHHINSENFRGKLPWLDFWIFLRFGQKQKSSAELLAAGYCYNTAETRRFGDANYPVGDKSGWVMTQAAEQHCLKCLLLVIVAISSSTRSNMWDASRDIGRFLIHFNWVLNKRLDKTRWCISLPTKLLNLNP